MSARDPGNRLTQFGKYLLDGEIATGGMSKVFRARLRGPGGFEKRLVVKQILPQLAQDPNFIRMFVQEANTLVQMSHPNIVPVYELGVVDGVYFLAMELVQGATLAEILREGPLPEALVAHLGIQLCDALHYAHDRFSVVHRDVTPRNLVIDDAGHARLLDFGIAAPADETGRFGSLGYMSPEQARGLPVGPESDLFSVGTLLFEALSATPAYLREAAEDTRHALLDEPAPEVPPQVASEPMRQWVARCLAREVAARPRSAAEVAKGLRGLLAASHPAGVAEELGRRALQARLRNEQRAQNEQPVSTSDQIRATGPMPGKNRTLATSPILDQLLQQHTERIERPSPLPTTDVSAVPIDHAAPITTIASATTANTPAASATIANTTQTLGPVVGSRSWMLWLSVAALLLLGVWSLAPLRPQPQPATVSTPTLPSTKPATKVEPAATQPSPSPSEPVDTTRVTPPAKPIDTTPSEPGTPSPSINARAWLVINALPWAEVKVDGRALGSTPIRRAATDAGKHTIELSCPPLGRHARVPIQAQAGETVRVLVDLNQEPPRVTLK